MNIIRTLLLTLFLTLPPIISTPVWAGPIERIAYVTSEVDNTLTIVNLNEEKIIKVLPTGKTPHAMALTPSGKGYINNRNSDFLTIFDANHYEIGNPIPLPALSFQLSLSPDGKTLAVAYRNILGITLIDTATDTIIKTIKIGEEGHGFKGAMMRHPYWSKDGRFVYAQDNVNNTIVKINTITYEIVATIAMPGSNHYLQPTKDGKLIYACGETLAAGGTGISIIDTESNTILKTIPVPLAADEFGLGHHGEFTPDGKYFLYANSGGNSIAVINTQSLEVVKVLHGNFGPGHLFTSKNGKLLFVVNHKDHVVTVIDIGKQEIIKEIPVGTGTNQAHNGFFTSDGKYFYMINAKDGVLHKIDTTKLESVSTVAIGTSPMFFAIKEGSHFITEE